MGPFGGFLHLAPTPQPEHWEVFQMQKLLLVAKIVLYLLMGVYTVAGLPLLVADLTRPQAVMRPDDVADRFRPQEGRSGVAVYEGYRLKGDKVLVYWHLRWWKTGNEEPEPRMSFLLRGEDVAITSSVEVPTFDEKGERDLLLLPPRNRPAM